MLILLKMIENELHFKTSNKIGSLKKMDNLSAKIQIKTINEKIQQNLNTKMQYFFPIH